MAAFSPIIIVLVSLLLLSLATFSDSQCGKICSNITDCPSKMSCIGNRCDDDPTGLVTDPPQCPIPGCAPTSFIFPGPTIDQDHCFANQTYQIYSCSPPINRDLNFGILYFFDLVNEGIAKCNQQHYAESELVAAISTGWFNNGKHCFQNVTITASNGRSVVAKIVDECVSSSGCTPALYNYGPCSPKALSGTRGVWEALGLNISVGIVEIAWNFTSASSLDSLRLPRKNKSLAIAIACSVVGGSCAVIILLGLSLCLFKRVKNGPSSSPRFGDDMKKTLMPQQFTYGTLLAATNGFDHKSKLGEGGYGPVFRGELVDGTLIAVKRIGGSSKQGLKQFKAEVMSVGNIHHLNLVRLLGLSVQAPASFLLVYEFAANGSLDKWIFGLSRKLPWKTRVSVALDVARGLDYLHTGCREKILHLDIKPQNILLDEKMKGKIADFGFAKLIHKEKSHTVTAMRGTMGYMAPEWLNSRVTEKTDVFSYGVLLLELVFCYRHEMITEKLERMKLEELLEQEMEVEGEEFELSECEKMVRIGLLCSREDPQARPSMKMVVKWLEEGAESVDLPNSNSYELSMDPGTRPDQASCVVISVSDVSPR